MLKVGKLTTSVELLLMFLVWISSKGWLFITAWSGTCIPFLVTFLRFCWLWLKSLSYFKILSLLSYFSCEGARSWVIGEILSLLPAIWEVVPIWGIVPLLSWLATLTLFFLRILFKLFWLLDATLLIAEIEGLMAKPLPLPKELVLIFSADSISSLIEINWVG